MALSSEVDVPLETDYLLMHPLISWRSVIAGTLISFLGLSILLALGLAFGGIGLVHGVNENSVGMFSGVWFLISSVIALFFGSYFSGRVSKFHMGRLGAAQGALISALFFGYFLFESFAAIGWVGAPTVTDASTIQGVGWSLFALLVLGTFSAMVGGAFGARANLVRPLTREQYDSIEDLGPVVF
jgi:hypothetical protein